MPVTIRMMRMSLMIEIKADGECWWESIMDKNNNDNQIVVWLVCFEFSGYDSCDGCYWFWWLGWSLMKNTPQPILFVCVMMIKINGIISCVVSCLHLNPYFFQKIENSEEQWWWDMLILISVDYDLLISFKKVDFKSCSHLLIIILLLFFPKIFTWAFVEMVSNNSC